MDQQGQQIIATPEEANEAEAPVAPTVLIMHASVGSGHKSAAIAIEQAFSVLKERGEIPGNVNVEVIDIFDYSRIKFNGDNWASLFTGSTRPIYDITWRYLWTGRMLWGGGSAWTHGMFPQITKYIREVKPIAVICTHITACNAIVGARQIAKQKFPIICVPTDYETEGWWPHKAIDLFCVATESMAETLRARKVDEERICITGIPTREAFRKTYDKQATRERLGLPHDKPLVLALAGAGMPAPYALMRETIDAVIPYLHTLPKIHLAIVCGTDDTYARSLRRLCEGLALTNVTVFNFVTDMAELIAASDTVICKPGGLTVTECLVSQVPMILLCRAYGQEKINVRMLTAHGAAIHATTSRELLEALRRVSEHPESISSLLVNASILRRPNAALDIAKRTMTLAADEQYHNPFTDHRHFGRFYWGKSPAHPR